MDPLVPILSEVSNSTTDGVAEFIRCLAAMSIYGKSPTIFFDRRNSDVFPLAHERSEPIFCKVKTGLSQPSMIIYMHCTSSVIRILYFVFLDNAQTTTTLSQHWNKPFQEHLEIRRTEKVLAEVCSSLAFVKHTTITSLDDDQYRLSSKLCDEIGLVRVNNPKKCFGPVGFLSSDRVCTICPYICHFYRYLAIL